MKTQKDVRQVEQKRNEGRQPVLGERMGDGDEKVCQTWTEKNLSQNFQNNLQKKNSLTKYMCGNYRRISLQVFPSPFKLHLGSRGVRECVPLLCPSEKER